MESNAVKSCPTSNPKMPGTSNGAGTSLGAGTGGKVATGVSASGMTGKGGAGAAGPSTSSPPPGPSGSTTAVTAAGGEPAVKKKKNRKKMSKEARQKRREEAALKGMRPKDSHIHMISPTVMEKIKAEKVSDSLRFTSMAAAGGQGQGRPRHSMGPVPSFGPTTTPENKLGPSPGSWLKSNSVWGSGSKPVPASLEIDFPVLGSPVPVKEQEQEPEDEDWETDREVEEEGSSPVQSRDFCTQTDDILEDESLLYLSPTLELTSPLATSTPTASSKKKPSKSPMVISLEALIQAKIERKSERKVSTPKQKQSSKVGEESENRSKSGMQKAGNILDSSGIQLMHRGKIREKPKLKKPTKLKQAILKTRALRKVTIGKCVGNMESPENRGPSGLRAEVNVEAVNANDSALNDTDELKPTPNPTAPIPIPIKFEPIELSDTEEKVHEAEGVVDDNIFRKLLDEAEQQILKSKSSELESDRKERLEVENTDNSTQDVPANVIETIKTQMHTRRWKKYCDMYTTKELHGHVIALMTELHRFQDRLYHSDPVKYKTRKKYVHGLKDVGSYLELNKVNLIIFAPDIESNDVKGRYPQHRLLHISQSGQELNEKSMFLDVHLLEPPGRLNIFVFFS
jgi:selenocysteine insertion sequence-binding protein 2